MKIKWWGHACFSLTANTGTVITDPYGDIGYLPISDKADIVTVSHDHFDHNAVDSLPGEPRLVKDLTTTTVNGISVRGIASYHDATKGAERGTNCIYVFDMDGLSVCHLGDLGESLDDQTIQAIGAVDILLVPVGGHYTIGAQQAYELVQRIAPSVIVPMHYQTPAIGFPIAPVDPFLSYFPSERVLRISQPELEIHAIPAEQQVFVLAYVQE